MKKKSQKPVSSIEERARELLEFARAEAKSSSSWESLHNAIFGIGGRAGRLFPTRADRDAFARTTEQKEIQAIVYALPSAPAVEEYSGQFRLRLPISIHAALAQEAEREGVSLNTLAVAKLSVGLSSLVK